MKNCTNRKIVIYTRVSTHNQKYNLQNQVKFLQAFANAKAMIVDETLKEVGSELHYHRKKWNELVEEVMEHKIDTILMARKDRFVRFRYDWFEKFFIEIWHQATCCKQ